mgnify:CR=1 FL=1
MSCFFSNGLNFSCKQCSYCCRHEPGFVYLSKNDLTKLCTWFKLNAVDFCKKYCRWVYYYDGTEVLCLQEKENYDCIYWDKGCIIYEARPVQCKTYPFWSTILKDKETWDNEADFCPGINKGTLHSAEEILNCKNLSIVNRPLCRDDFEKLFGES